MCLLNNKCLPTSSNPDNGAAAGGSNTVAGGQNQNQQGLTTPTPTPTPTATPASDWFGPYTSPAADFAKSTGVPLGTSSNNSLLYDNSTYGIKFQFPYGWNKVEVLSGRIINVEFTSPSGGNQLPAGVVMSIENGLGNITTLGQYSEESDKLLHAILGNFNSTAPRNNRNRATRNCKGARC